jgi:hypothetical protein
MSNEMKMNELEKVTGGADPLASPGPCRGFDIRSVFNNSRIGAEPLPSPSPRLGRGRIGIDPIPPR